MNGYEKNTLLPIIVRGLSNRTGAANAVSNGHICISLRNKGYKVTEVRIRKIINHIRIHGLVTLRERAITGLKAVRRSWTTSKA